MIINIRRKEVSNLKSGERPPLFLPWLHWERMFHTAREQPHTHLDAISATNQQKKRERNPFYVEPRNTLMFSHYSGAEASSVWILFSTYIATLMKVMFIVTYTFLIAITKLAQMLKINN